MLYVQAAQIDGEDHRNVLVGSVIAHFDAKNNSRLSTMFGEAVFKASQVSRQLSDLGFAANAPLSVLAVEMLPQVVQPTAPLSTNLGGQRNLTHSRCLHLFLISVARELCVECGQTYNRENGDFVVDSGSVT
jgi:hypothetical protein